jgi:hypothetical protein
LNRKQNALPEAIADVDWVFLASEFLMGFQGSFAGSSEVIIALRSKGKWILNVVPLPGWLSTAILPP